MLGRAEPDRITTELIDRLSPAKLCRQVIDYELSKETYSEAFDALMCAVELHSEVFNGGFNQYYYNTDGERAECAHSMFVRWGADRVARIVDDANRCYASNRDERQAVWDGTLKGFSRSYQNDPFARFDREYYASMKNDKQLYELIGNYIKHHPEEFLTDEPGPAHHQKKLIPPDGYHFPNH